MTASASPSFSSRDLVSLNRVGALSVHPDGTWAAVVVERLDADGSRYVSDLWRLALAGDAPAERLTRGDHKDKAPAFAADGTLYFLSDRQPEGAKGDDDKRSQVWALGAHGEPRQVTDEPLGVTDLRVGGATLVAVVGSLPGRARDTWREAAADRKKHGPTIVTSTRMPARYWDRWLGPDEPRLVAWDLSGAGAATAATTNGRLPAGLELTRDGEGRALLEPSWDVSADGRTVATTWASINPIDRLDDESIVLIDTSSGARRVVGQAPFVVNGPLCFTPDGQGVVSLRYTRSRHGYGARALWRYGADGDAQALTEGWDRWPTPRAFTPDGQAIVVTAEEEGRVRAFRVGLDGAVTPLGPATGTWHDMRVTAAGLVGARSSILHPPEVFTLAWDAAEPTPCAPLSGFRGDVVATVHDRRFEVDGRSIQSWVVEPTTPAERTFFWIHGGPVAAWLDQWQWRWSPYFMAAQGYRAVLPNPAGSTGFGLAWVDDIWGNTWGDRCYRDLMGIVDQLETEGVAARDMVAMGGSFGGYMTNWIGSQTDRFRVLVTHASLFHLSAFHLATDVPAWWELMFGGTMWSDPATFDADRCSPSRGIERWSTPTLILHGEKDYRVPITEGLMLFEALQRRGVPSELAVFPDENHWILRPRNIVAWLDTVLSFLNRHWSPVRDPA